ncbi:hypothetical protein M378DRAFT_14057 [Amanita muscaria Koide BX008]|uniref:Uncharacterized protein n=1 Tax=Amanita muscaria (strain Koide BX008) TaxID=946122 RepID=A0A0C2WUY3_AMAMK|nr:hypothetical protein M378DRAFT_14057 [Amanita muscaria Koide BX008]
MLTTEEVVEGAVMRGEPRRSGIAVETQARMSAEGNIWLNGHVLKLGSCWRWDGSVGHAGMVLGHRLIVLARLGHVFLNRILLQSRQQ